MSRLAVAGTLLLAACANTQWAGLNAARVTAPTGETWEVVSGKDQTDTSLTVRRGDVIVTYSSTKEDATAALSAALTQQAEIIKTLITLVPKGAVY